MEEEIAKAEDKGQPLKPLQPVKIPDVAEMIARSLSSQQSTPRFAPLGPVASPTQTAGACPHGLAGLCIVCPRYPCNYMLSRVLRSLLAKAEEQP